MASSANSQAVRSVSCTSVYAPCFQRRTSRRHLGSHVNFASVSRKSISMTIYHALIYSCDCSRYKTILTFGHAPKHNAALCQITLTTCCYYRQHCAQRKPAGISFTQRPILRFFAPQRRHVAPMGVKFGTEEGTKAKFHSDLTEIWNINAPQGRIPCAIFTKFAEFVPHFRMSWVLKFGWICSRGYGVMGVLS